MGARGVTFAIYSAAYEMTTHFGPRCGFRDERMCGSEASAVLYVFNRWPQLRIAPHRQVGEIGGVSGRSERVVIWILADAEQSEPCAAMVCPERPMFIPNWELWRPYFEGSERVE